MRNRSIILLVAIFVAFVILYNISSQTSAVYRIHHVNNHNVITIKYTRNRRNITKSTHRNPVIVFMTSSRSLTESATLVSSVARSLRLPFYPIYAYESPSHLQKMIREKTFQMIIFEDFLMYFNLAFQTKTALDEYCRNENVSVIGFMNGVNTLRGLPDDPQFTELDSSYPLLVRRLKRLTAPSAPPSSGPQGFYLAQDSDLFYVTRPGQADTRPLVDQLPPCDSWERSPLCFFERRDRQAFSSLRSEVAEAINTPMEDLLPSFHWLLQNSFYSAEEIKTEQANWRANWATFVPNGSRHWDKFETIAFTKVPIPDPTRASRWARESCEASSNPSADSAAYQSLVVRDVGVWDGVQRLLFAYSPTQHWSTTLLLHDALHRFLTVDYDLGMERFVHVDIDDVFVAHTGTRMTDDDVNHLIETQKRWRQIMPGFTFYLGFSGSFVASGDKAEQRGAQALIANRHHFKWFCHTFTHAQAHLISEEMLLNELRLNKAFAEEKDLPIAEGYSVAPHHSGVFPVMPHLYRAWRTVWGINLTTTEGYPTLYPAYNRMGFKTLGIQVLPRQTCGVFTTTTLTRTFPGGIQRLDGLSFGGELFKTFLFSPVNLYMTHYGNYALDRLATYAFDRAFAWVRDWTRLSLRWAPVQELVQHHLAFNPTANQTPLHSDPCVDPRHAAIWPPSACIPGVYLLPSVVIVGPQKTGSTALLVFMSMHPEMQPNRMLSTTAPFEEVQFFSHNQYYEQGVGFYSSLFDNFSAPWPTIYFEKSANYFDTFPAAQRMARLLPRAKVIIILKEPTLRVLSWYQHQRAHKISAALKFTFEELLLARTPEVAAAVAAAKNASHLAKELYDLHLKCVLPSLYVTHLQRWLLYYRADQILLVDAERLESNPAAVMMDVQEFTKVQNYLDYSKILVHSPNKGYFCATGGPYPKAGTLLRPLKNLWCLSQGKGRPYNHTVASAAAGNLFDSANRELASLILQHPFWRPNRSHSASDLLPKWLKSLL